MAKVGYEVEGMLKGEGVLTYFCSAEEFLDRYPEELIHDLYANEVDMIYISDHHNVLCLDYLAEIFDGLDFAVTVELTELTSVPPDRISIFWNVSQASYAQSRTIHFLRFEDQIKIENEKNVLSFVAGNAVVTRPSDFAGDIEV